MRTTYRVLYRLGFTPWDTAAIPAPLADSRGRPNALPPGLAVDLGCGTGRQALFLADQRLGPSRRRRRARSPDAGAREVTTAAATAHRHGQAEGRINWRLADVTDPGQVDPGGRLAARRTLLLDNGCLHGIPDPRRPGWAATVH